MTKKIWAPGVVKRVADGLTHKADGKHNQAKGLAIKSIPPGGRAAVGVGGGQEVRGEGG